MPHVDLETLPEFAGSIGLLFPNPIFRRVVVRYDEKKSELVVAIRSAGAFWSADRRKELAREVGFESVPELGRGRCDLAGLKKVLGRSALTEGPAEGLYVRRKEGGRLLDRVKLVRAEFVQAIGEHWSKRTIEINQLAKGAVTSPPR